MKLRRSLRCSSKFLLDCLYHTVFSKTSDFYGSCGHFLYMVTEQDGWGEVKACTQEWCSQHDPHATCRRMKRIWKENKIKTDTLWSYDWKKKHHENSHRDGVMMRHPQTALNVSIPQSNHRQEARWKQEKASRQQKKNNFLPVVYVHNKGQWCHEKEKLRDKSREDWHKSLWSNNIFQ